MPLYCSYDGAVFDTATTGFVQTFPAAEPFPVIPLAPRIEVLLLNEVAYGSRPLKNVVRLGRLKK